MAAYFLLFLDVIAISRAFTKSACDTHKQNPGSSVAMRYHAVRKKFFGGALCRAHIAPKQTCAFHCILCTCNTIINSQWWNAGMDNTDTLHPFLLFFSIPTSTVRVKITCPNLREEYSSCGPYKFTYNIAYAHARRSNGSCTALCAQRTKSSQSLVHGTAIVEAWVY